MDVTQVLVSAIASGSVAAAVAGTLLQRRNAQIQENIRLQFARLGAAMSSQRTWKERAVAELLAPVFIHLDRTERAFKRWKERNLYLEQKVVGEGNAAIRDLLISKTYLIPPELREDAARRR